MCTVNYICPIFRKFCHFIIDIMSSVNSTIYEIVGNSSRRAVAKKSTGPRPRRAHYSAEYSNSGGLDVFTIDQSLIDLSSQLEKSNIESLQEITLGDFGTVEPQPFVLHSQNSDTVYDQYRTENSQLLSNNTDDTTGMPSICNVVSFSSVNNSNKGITFFKMPQLENPYSQLKVVEAPVPVKSIDNFTINYEDLLMEEFDYESVKQNTTIIDKPNNTNIVNETPVQVKEIDNDNIDYEDLLLEEFDYESVKQNTNIIDKSKDVDSIKSKRKRKAGKSSEDKSRKVVVQDNSIVFKNRNEVLVETPVQFIDITSDTEETYPEIVSRKPNILKKTAKETNPKPRLYCTRRLVKSNLPPTVMNQKAHIMPSNTASGLSKTIELDPEMSLADKKKEILKRMSRIEDLTPFNLLNHFTEDDISMLGGEISEVEPSNAVYGFERGLKAKRLIGTTRKDNMMMYIIQWEGCNFADVVPASEAKYKCPQVLISFYEERFKRLLRNQALVKKI